MPVEEINEHTDPEVSPEDMTIRRFDQAQNIRSLELKHTENGVWAVMAGISDKTVTYYLVYNVEYSGVKEVYEIELEISLISGMVTITFNIGDGAMLYHITDPNKIPAVISVLEDIYRIIQDELRERK